MKTSLYEQTLKVSVPFRNKRFGTYFAEIGKYREWIQEKNPSSKGEALLQAAKDTSISTEDLFTLLYDDLDRGTRPDFLPKEIPPELVKQTLLAEISKIDSNARNLFLGKTGFKRRERTGDLGCSFNTRLGTYYISIGQYIDWLREKNPDLEGEELIEAAKQTKLTKEDLFELFKTEGYPAELTPEYVQMKLVHEISGENCVGRRLLLGEWGYEVCCTAGRREPEKVFERFKEFHWQLSGSGMIEMWKELNAEQKGEVIRSIVENDVVEAVLERLEEYYISKVNIDTNMRSEEETIAIQMRADILVGEALLKHSPGARYEDWDSDLLELDPNPDFQNIYPRMKLNYTVEEHKASIGPSWSVDHEIEQLEYRSGTTDEESLLKAWYFADDNQKKQIISVIVSNGKAEEMGNLIREKVFLQEMPPEDRSIHDWDAKPTESTTNEDGSVSIILPSPFSPLPPMDEQKILKLWAQRRKVAQDILPYLH